MVLAGLRQHVLTNHEHLLVSLYACRLGRQKRKQMNILKLLLFIPLIIFNCAETPLPTKKPKLAHLKSAKVISVERDIPGSGVIHWLAVITVSTPKNDAIKLHVTYGGKQQVFPKVGSNCTIAAKEKFINGIAADNISVTDKLLLVPTSLECDGKFYPPKEISMAKACKGKYLNARNASLFFERSSITPVTTYHYHYIASPCSYWGQVEYKGNIWDFLLYPSGYGSLKNETISPEKLFFTCYACGIFQEQNLTSEETLP